MVHNMESRQFPYAASAKEWLYGHAEDYIDILAMRNSTLSPRVKTRREDLAWRKLHTKFARKFPGPHLSLQEMIDLNFHYESEAAQLKANHLKVSLHIDAISFHVY